MYIEGIALEHFSALPQIEINSSTKPFSIHAVFHYFLSDDSKQDSATTTSHNKCLEIIKKVYKQAGKWDDQKQFKNILKADMVSTP